MSVREALQDRRVGSVVAGVLLLIAGAIAFATLRPSRSLPNLKKAFYSDDDGQSYFTDSAFKIAPWDHDGKTAVLAAVYSEDGHKYVAFLRRFKPDAKKKLEASYAADPDNPVKTLDLMAALGAGATEVKVPGPNHPWVSGNSLRSLNLQPPGPDFPDLVMP